MTITFNTRPKTVAAIVMVFCPLAFVISMPWLKSQPEGIVQLFGGIAATGTVVASFVLAVLKDQDLDEWHRGAARFSNQWGWLAGGGLIAILQGLPVFQRLIIDATGRLTPSAAADKTTLLAFMLGFMAVIIAQMVCTLALNKGWRSWMSREAS